MELICPNCKTEILNSNVSIAEAVASCVSCSKSFKIAELTNNEQIIRIQKPFYSKIQIEDNLGSHTIKMKIADWDNHKKDLLIIIFSNFFVWFMYYLLILNSKNSKDFALIFPTIILGFFILITTLSFFNFWYRVLGQIQINFNTEFVSVKWSCLKLCYTQQKNTIDLTTITEVPIYNGQKRGVEFCFKKSERIKFGYYLQQEERKWLIGELNELKEKYQLH